MTEGSGQTTDLAQVLPLPTGDIYPNLADRAKAVTKGPYEKSKAKLRKSKAPDFPPFWTPGDVKRFK